MFKKKIPNMSIRCKQIILTLEHLRVGHFDPTIFSKSNNFLFAFFCAPFFSIAEFLPFYHQLVHFLCSESHYFGIWGPWNVTNWRFLAFFEKRKKIGKNWKIDFFWKFLFWSVVNYPSCTLSEFWGENSKIF